MKTCRHRCSAYGVYAVPIKFRVGLGFLTVTVPPDQHILLIREGGESHGCPIAVDTAVYGIAVALIHIVHAVILEEPVKARGAGIMC